MRNQEVVKVLRKIYHELETMGYTVFAVILQGSQNYNLDIHTEEYSSDIDCKAFVMPSFKDVYSGDKVSKVYKNKWGQVEVKDIRLLEELLSKANPSYMELLASDYVLSSDGKVWAEMSKLLPQLVSERKALLIKCIYGMAKEKEKALCHPYPATEEKIAKFGYDPKQAHHIVRLKYMMEDLLIFRNEDLKDILTHSTEGARRKYLLDIKVGKYTLEEIRGIVEENINSLKTMKDKYESEFPITSESLYALRSLVEKLVKENLTKELTNK